MDDVLGDVVLAPGDEYLGPEQTKMVAVRLRSRAHGGEVRARLRLGQVHCSSPLASDHLRQKALLELVRRVVRERLHGSHGQHLTQREGQIGGFPHLGHRARNQRRHSLPADVGASRHRVPAGFDELPVRLREAIGRGDLAVAPAAALAVPGRVQRRQHFAGETGGLGQDRLDEFRIRLLEAGQGGDLRQPGHMVEHEPHVVQRGCIGHDPLSLFFAASRSMNFWILPVEVLGIGPNTTTFGTL